MIEDDERATNAILDWLGEQRGAAEGAAVVQQLADDPLAFLQRHLHLLPTHLLELVGQRTSRRQRGTLAVIRDRRRRFAHTVHPEELSVEEGRKRNPLLYKDVTGSGRAVRSAASTSSVADTSASKSKKASETVATPEQVLSRPRFSALVQHFDEQDVAATLQRQEDRRAETSAEVEEEEEEEEKGAEVGQQSRASAHDLDAEISRLLVAQFVRGDDAGLPHELYRCDYDEQWDRYTGAPTAPRQGVVRAMDSEERWFDEEEAD